MTDLDRERHEARLLTTDDVVKLRRAHSEAQLYIATLSDALAARDRYVEELEAALGRTCDAVPVPVNDEPTVSRTKTRRRAA